MFSWQTKNCLCTIPFQISRYTCNASRYSYDICFQLVCHSLQLNNNVHYFVRNLTVPITRLGEL